MPAERPSLGTVVLVHGLWMHGLAMTLMGRRLAAAGYEIARVDYHSFAERPDQAIKRIAKAVERAGISAPPVHIVGHSLGGLLSLAAIRDGTIGIDGRIVCLGSPLAGSATARQLVEGQLGPWLVGRCSALLAKGLEHWPGPNEVGMIAGTMGIGLGRLLGAMDVPHDGTVAVEETRIDGLTDHIEIEASHSGLIASAAVADLVETFLRDGRFTASAAASA